MTRLLYLASVAFLLLPPRLWAESPQAAAKNHAAHGDQLYAKKDWAAAQSEYLKALYLDPDNPRYHADLAGVSNWLKDSNGAKVAADHASRLGYKIIDVWESLGGPMGELGLPTSGERSVSPSNSPSRAVTRTYEHGAIYWYTDGPMKGKAVPIYGVSAEKYVGHKEILAQIGFPVSAETDTAESPQGTHGRQQACERGGIYWHTDGPRSRHAYVVGGGLWTTYLHTGGPSSALGLPISDDHGPSDHRWSEYEGGFIVWNKGEKDAVHLNDKKEQTVEELLDQRTPALLKAFHVPGVSLAVVDHHKVVWTGQYGVLQAGSNRRVGPHTRFEAASMSKPVFAYAALKLLEQGKLDLDRPLVQYLPKPYLKNEPLHELITARMVLVHTTGFPNWREGGWVNGGPLHVEFQPGTKFQYSGEGFFYLQHVVEQITGMTFDRYAKKALLGPLGMEDSSYVWLDSFANDAASPHNDKGEVMTNRYLERRANVASTLYTTAGDYALILVEMMKVDRTARHSLQRYMLDQMLNPASPPAEFRTLGWEHWGSPVGRIIGHGGANMGFRSHAKFNPAQGNGIVIMTNSEGGGDQLIDAIGKAIDWRYDWRWP